MDVLHSWDSVSISDTVHSMRHRKPHLSILWCGKRVEAPRRLKDGEITCRACVRAVYSEARRLAEVEHKLAKAQQVVVALVQERTAILSNGMWPRVIKKSTKR